MSDGLSLTEEQAIGRAVSKPQNQPLDWAADSPSVSIVIPMRNEEQYIGACLAAIVAQDYDDNLEVLVIDGMSEDRSQEIVSRFAETYPFIQLLENPKLTAPAAMNIGVRHATGDIIVRVDGHTILDPDYVRQCVACLQRTGAGSVGGLQRAIGQNYLGETIALTTQSPLAVGDSKFRYAQEEGEVDTVYLGAFPREVFEEVGLYNENLLRNQDYEFNYRIRRAGMSVYLDPAIRSWYINRSTLVAFWKQYVDYGYWKVEMLSQHPASVRWRQLVPPAFVVSLITTGLLGRFYRPLAVLFRVIVGAYTALAGLFTVRTAKVDGWRYLPALPVVFASMHLCWGLGFLWGVARLPQRIIDKPAHDD